MEGCIDCQQGLLLNRQNSHQAEMEASSCGRYMHTSLRRCDTQIYWYSRGLISPSRPQLLFHFNWTLYLEYVLRKHTHSVGFSTVHQLAVLYMFLGGRLVVFLKKTKNKCRLLHIRQQIIYLSLCTEYERQPCPGFKHHFCVCKAIKSSWMSDISNRILASFRALWGY